MEPDSVPAACNAVTRSESSWSDREQQALDGLRAVAAFLHHHANTDVARALSE
jgi:hypothetical protein